ncbi:MAG TPA: hypothetical protein VMQ11_11780 [Alphaproteobacteria bacterium]|nr:hypothetical protein [Alphaproteobacteria bacterium]
MARRAAPFFPLMMVELAMAASETIFHRTWLMATGQCSPAEYQRMLAEKVKAAQLTGRLVMSPRADSSALLAPWHRAARRNARRLRRS